MHRLLARAAYLLRQLLPLRYRTECLVNGTGYRAEWRMWLGRVYAHKATLLGVVAFLLAFLPACTTVRDAQRIDEMSPAEFSRFEVRVASQARHATSAALDGGDISPDGAMLVAQALQGLANGTVSGALSAMPFEGWGALALSVAISEADAQLDAMGAYDEGGALSPRGGEVLRAVAEAIEGEVAEFRGEGWAVGADG